MWSGLFITRVSLQVTLTKGYRIFINVFKFSNETWATSIPSHTSCAGRRPGQPDIVVTTVTRGRVTAQN